MSKNISHVIHLLLENRSFDHVLGTLKKTYPTLDGIDPAAPAKNNYQGSDYLQSAGAARYLNFDPRHEYEHVMLQLSGRNGGFVQDFSQSYPKATPTDRAEVMNYHDLGKLPAIHELAQNFTICDHWFSSVPGPTWCNRLFALSGTSLGRVAMPEGIMNLNVHWYSQPTLFDRLNEQHISWKVYSGDAPLSLLFVHQWEPQNAARYRPMTEFYRDVASFKKEGDPTDQDLPLFTFIEPSYWQPGANDAHPPHDILAADALVRNVYNAIRTNNDLWEQTLLVIAFDEHGGFFDHVTPPATVPPDYHQDEYTFDQFGVRVPVILVSPWVNNAVFPDTMDHTSLLKYLTGKWSLGPLGYRTQVAATFDAAFVDSMRDVLPPIVSPLPAPAIGRPPQMESLNSHSRAMVALSHVLESMAEEDANIVAARTRQVLSGPQSQIDAAFDRFEGFLRVRGNR
jgi:phospholipase C